MSTHARNPSTVSDSGSESSLTSLSSSDAQQPTQPSAPPPSAQPVRARNPSVISKAGSESSLTTLSSSDESERLGPEPRVPRPQTPNTRNATDIPGLTFSPSSVLSSPESTRSYGFSALEEYSALGNVVKEILDSGAAMHEVDNLYAQAQKHLAVFDDPRYASLDTPDWVQRVSKRGAMQPVMSQFTVRKLFKAMCDTAEDLKIENGKRYVVAAVSACAIKAKGAEQKELDLAQRLQRLASTWAAFLLWPCTSATLSPVVSDIPGQDAENHGTHIVFAQQHNIILSVNDVSSCATPTRMETASLMDEGLSENRKGDLRDKVLKRDGYRCVLSGALERSIYEERKINNQPTQTRFTEDLEVCHIFKRSVAVYSSSSDKASDKDKFRSAAVTFELLRHYCQLDPKYLKNDMDFMDMPGNAMSLTAHFHKTFDEFLWCLKPTATANCYEVKEYDRATTYMDLFSIPPEITFKDHTTEATVTESTDHAAAAPRAQAGLSLDGEQWYKAPKRSHSTMSQDLPDPELLRLHAALTGVLRMSGAAGVFKLIMERRGPGNPPVPSADGDSFIKEVVDPEMHELRESLAGLWPAGLYE